MSLKIHWARACQKYDHYVFAYPYATPNNVTVAKIVYSDTFYIQGILNTLFLR